METETAAEYIVELKISRFWVSNLERSSIPPHSGYAARTAMMLRNMRKRGEALANRYRVEFIDTTGDIVMPDIPEPERRKQEETTTDGTSLSAIRHRARRRGLVFSKSRKDGGLYRLAMADGGANFHLDASFESKRANQGAGDPRF